jgi:hypothetical protein
MQERKIWIPVCKGLSAYKSMITNYFLKLLNFLKNYVLSPTFLTGHLIFFLMSSIDIISDI